MSEKEKKNAPQEEQPQEQGDGAQADEQGDTASSAETNGPEEEQDDI